MSTLAEQFREIKRKAFRIWNRQLLKNAAYYQLIRGEPMGKNFPPTLKKPKIPATFDPVYNGVLRSVKGTDHWVIVIDMDGEDLCNDMLTCAYDVYRSCPNDQKPVIKGSGKKGVQLYWISEWMPDSEFQRTARDWVYTKYVELDIKKKYDILFGKDKNDPKHPHWDITMYQPTRMWRPFCARMTGYDTNGRYSVPLSVGDDLDMAQRKMGMDLSLVYEKTTYRKPIKLTGIKHHFDLRKSIKGSLPYTAKPTYDKMMKRLTAMGRAIVLHDGRVEHDHAYALVAYIYCYMGIRDPEDIFNFLWERVKWSNKDRAEMRYQIQDICQKCHEKHPEKPVNSFMWRRPDDEE